MDDFDVKRPLEILYQYSVEDITETLFITDVFPANIAAPVKISVLWEIFRGSEPLKYQAENKIKNYKDYQALASRLIALIPGYPTVEDVDLRGSDPLKISQSTEIF